MTRILTRHIIRVMPPLADLVDVMKKDPVRGYVAIPIAAAAAPNPSIVVPFKTGKGEIYNRLQVPLWSGTEWAWWGQAGLNFATRVRNQEGMLRDGPSWRSISHAMSDFAPLLQEMQSLGAAKPSPALIDKFYNKAVRLVIEAKNAKKWESIVAEWFGDTFASAPITVTEGLRWLGGASTQAIHDVAEAAAKILAAMGQGLLSGLGIGTIAMIGLGLWWYFDGRKTRSYSDGEEA